MACRRLEEKSDLVLGLLCVYFAVSVASPLITKEPSEHLYAYYDYGDYDNDDGEKDTILKRKCNAPGKRPGPFCHGDEELIEECCVFCLVCYAGRGKPPGTVKAKDLCLAECVPCIEGKTFRDYKSTLACEQCVNCEEDLNRVQKTPCSIYTDAKCGQCKPGYVDRYPGDNMSFCSRCTAGTKGCPDVKVTYINTKTSKISLLPKLRTGTVDTTFILKYVTEQPTDNRENATAHTKHELEWNPINPSTKRLKVTKKKQKTPTLPWRESSTKKSKTSSYDSKFDRFQKMTKSSFFRIRPSRDKSQTTPMILSISDSHSHDSSRETPPWMIYIMTALAFLCFIVIVALARNGLVYEIISDYLEKTQLCIWLRERQEKITDCADERYLCVWLRKQEKSSEKDATVVVIEMANLSKNEVPEKCNIAETEEDIRLLRSERPSIDSVTDLILSETGGTLGERDPPKIYTPAPGPDEVDSHETDSTDPLNTPETEGTDESLGSETTLKKLPAEESTTTEDRNTEIKVTQHKFQTKGQKCPDEDSGPSISRVCEKILTSLKTPPEMLTINISVNPTISVNCSQNEHVATNKPEICTYVIEESKEDEHKNSP